MKKTILIAMLAAIAWGPVSVQAFSSNPGVTKQEWNLLPPHCLYVEGAPDWSSAQATRLRAADGTWVHMHHYCWAIVQTFRTYRNTMTPKLRTDYMNAALANLDYVIDRSRPGFVLRPDMFVRKAGLLARLGNFVEAADAARQLISESPELPEGYIALADVQIRAGQPARARETLAQGEQAVADKARFEALKGTLNLRH